MFEQLVVKVGLLNLLQLQPKQVTCSGVRELVTVLQGTQLHLIQFQDRYLDESEINVAHASPAHTGFHSSDPLGLESEGPDDLENGEITDDPRAPEQMD